MTHYRSYQQQFITLSLLSSCLISLRWIIKHALNIIPCLHPRPTFWSLFRLFTVNFLFHIVLLHYASRSESFRETNFGLSKYYRTYARVLILGRLYILSRNAATQLAWSLIHSLLPRRLCWTDSTTAFY